MANLVAEITPEDIWKAFEGCPIQKVYRVKDTYCFVHVPDINTALDIMRERDGERCGSRQMRISLCTNVCKRYGVPPQPHRKPQLLLRGMPPDANVEDVRVFLADYSGVIDMERTEILEPGTWSIVVNSVNDALSCQEALDGKFFLGNNVEVRLSDASSRCLSLPPQPNRGS